jgi:hypothetical protein
VSVQVWVGGVLLESIAPVYDLEDSTRFSIDGGYSGDYEMSCTWAAPSDFSASWFHEDADVLIRDGFVEWSGFLGDPVPGDLWQLNGFGWGADTSGYPCAVTDALDIDDAIDDAHAAGMGWGRHTNSFTGDISHALGEPAEPIMLDAALDVVAKTQGKVWLVSGGVGALVAEHTTVDHLMAPASTYLGTTDQNFLTALYGWFVNSLDGDGNPDGWDLSTPVVDTATELVRRRHSGVVDMTKLGLVSSGDVAAILAERFAQVGARAGFTNGFDMTALNSRRFANGVPAPMSTRAGDRVRIPMLTDTRSFPTYGFAYDVTLGMVRRIHKEQRATVTPVGFVTRGFDAALAAAQPKPTAVEVL